MLNNPVKETSPGLHRFWFSITDVKQWYAIMSDCRECFGKNWQCQGKVRRKLESVSHTKLYKQPQFIWFDIPDPGFATWVAIKHSIQVLSNYKSVPGK